MGNRVGPSIGGGHTWAHREVNSKWSSQSTAQPLHLTAQPVQQALLTVVREQMKALHAYSSFPLLSPDKRPES